jgi:undecaprenyl-diphosphatase
MVSPLRRNGLTILWVVGALAAVALTVYLERHPNPVPGELRFARWLQTQPVATLARIGNDFAYSHVSVPFGLMLALLALVWRRLDLAFLLAMPAIVRPINGAIKRLVERERPTDLQVRVSEHAAGFSFPSGHAFGSALLLFAAIVCIWRLPLPRSIEIAGTIGLLGLTVICGLARVYVGAHWPTDVGGAWLIAALWIGLLARIADFIWLRFGPMDHF